MKTCQKCKSDRILEVCGKTSDMCFVRFKDTEQSDYVPDGLGICGPDSYGDYIEFDVCLECGQVQGKWPVKKNPKFSEKVS
jgi:hypothetical protein